MPTFRLKSVEVEARRVRDPKTKPDVFAAMYECLED